MATPAPATITYGDHTIDPAALPASSITALLRRGVSHFLGNEVASKVSTAVAKIGSEAVEALGPDADDDAKAAARKAAMDGVTDETRATLRADYTTAALKAMIEGTMGEGRSSGPRKDPFEAACESIAKDQVLAVLKQAGLKAPRGDKTINMQGQDYTMEQLVARRLGNDKYRPAIEKEARRRVKELEAATKARGEVEAGAVPDMESLGL